MPQLAPLYWFISFLFFWGVVFLLCSLLWWFFSFKIVLRSSFLKKDISSCWYW